MGEGCRVFKWQVGATFWRSCIQGQKVSGGGVLMLGVTVLMGVLKMAIIKSIEERNHHGVPD